MQRATVSLVAAAWLLSGCDVGSSLWSRAQSTGDAAAVARPEGWESVEGESAATRLYYQFVDARGQVRFVERLDDVPRPLRPSVGFVKLDVPPPLSPADAARARQARRERSDGGRLAAAGDGSGGVVLYGADWCSACQKAKRHLSRRGIEFQERNIDEPRWQSELLRKTGRRAIPVIDVGGRILTGFSADEYDALIDRA